MRGFAVLVIVGAASSTFAKVTPSKTMVARVTIVDGSTDAEPITEIGTPVTIRYEIENTGKDPVTLWHSGFWPNHRIVIEASRGKLCNQGRCVGPKLTKVGADRAASFSPRGSRDKNAPWVVKPGTKDASEGSYDLAEMAELAVAGRYTVQVDYEEDIAFSSNKLAFWRVPKGARALLDALNAGTSTTASLAALAKLGVDVSQDPKTKRYQVTATR